MYSSEKKKHAVELYIKYDKSCAAVINEIGYPCRVQLLAWHRAYVEHGVEGLDGSMERYSPEQKAAAVDHYFEHGRCNARTRRALGYPRGFDTLREWIEELEPERCGSRRSVRSFTYGQKKDAVIDLETGKVPAQEIADACGVGRCTIYRWRRELLGERRCKKMDDKGHGPAEVRDLQRRVDDLEEQVRRLELEKDILEGSVEILKKGRGVDPANLTNRERAELVDALRPKYMLKEILPALKMARSSYQYQVESRCRPDRYAAPRGRIAEIFIASRRRYGYRRVHSALRDCGMTVSEKVVCRIMREEGLVSKRGKRRRYSSYMGELSDAPENIAARDFHADAPNELWLTDVTEFRIPAGKVYLSPMIDCFDGMVVSWTLSTSPNAEMANTMLASALETLDGGERPVVHSDRGSHYRWPGWIGICEKYGVTRSMSKKGCSPDNSAMEGFFGRLKVEMFYGESWAGWSVEAFMGEVEKYIRWYNEERIKQSLGGTSPCGYRRKLGIAA